MTSNPRSIPVWLVASIVLTALLSLYSISYRYRVESRNKAVTIAAEYETIESLAAAQGIPTEDAFAKLKAQGLGAVVLSEESIVDLVNSGRATMPSGTIEAVTPADRSRIQRGLESRFALNWPHLMPNRVGRPLEVPSISASTLRGVSVGLNPDQAAKVRNANLGIVARMSNPAGVSGKYVRATIRDARELGATIFLPQGDQVLGRRDALKDLTEELQAQQMLYASPEFTKLGGDANVLVSVPGQVVRLHSAQSAELDKLTLGDAVDRYTRAAKERGMRVLLVRPVSFASEAPLNSLSEFITAINRGCQDQGLEMGAAHPYDESNVPRWLFLLIGLSIVPTVYFVGATFVQNKIGRIAGLVLALAIGALAFMNSGRSLTALVAALAFPIAAFLILDARKRPNLILDFILVSLISLTGGLAVAGLLNDLPYYIRADQFGGVKVAVFLPIAIVALYFLMRGTDIKAALKNPMTWGAAVMAIVILGALAFMSSRTGNDNPAGVSDLELKMRFLLDQILIVRPRTKEFLIGHPLLILGIGLLAAHKARPNPKLAVWTALALAGGAIGQTDIVNTMCHLHTPVLLSLTRIGVGMVAGCIIGLVVWAIAKRWLPAGDI